MEDLSYTYERLLELAVAVDEVKTLLSKEDADQSTLK